MKTNLLAITAVILAVLLVSSFKDKENEASLGSKRIELNFGGIEDAGKGYWLKNPNLAFFQSKIFLSDQHLNNSTSSSELILELDCFSNSFLLPKGVFRVVSAEYFPKSSSEKLVQAKILTLQDTGKGVKVVDGNVTFSEKDEVHFNITLENGQHLQGSYDKGLEDFKYSF